MEIGVYGKLPSHGDFLRRRVSDTFVGVWDAWLQQAVAASRESLGERWLDLYLTSPAWRFACAPGPLGAATSAGVMVPSVDRVGRYFPLTVLASGIGESSAEAPGPLALALRATAWFDTIERATVEALAAERPDFEAYDALLRDSATQLEQLLGADGVTLDPEDARAVVEEGGQGWWLPLAGAGSLAGIVEQLASARLAALTEPMTLFWTEGSTVVAPCCLLLSGLPDPRGFASLLDGAFEPDDGWRIARGRLRVATAADDTIARDAPSITYESGAASDAGPVRAVNQDAYLERREVGIWVVADGMGGHEQGEVASRMVCDALAEIVPGSTLEATATDVRRRLGEVNEHLLRAARRPVGAVQSGSTVVALLARGPACEVLWAGDSRAYRWRAGTLFALTHDHVWADRGAATTDEESYSITRAVGGEDNLELDAYHGRMQPGDRLLLCSDGLTRVLSDARIAELVASGTPVEAAAALVAAALAGGTTDNVTALVVSAR